MNKEGVKQRGLGAVNNEPVYGPLLPVTGNYGPLLPLNFVTEREKERDKETERETERDTESETDTESEREKEKEIYM